jgi:hypothetical protein
MRCAGEPAQGRLNTGTIHAIFLEDPMKTATLLILTCFMTIPLCIAMAQWTATATPFVQGLDLLTDGDNIIYACSGSSYQLYWSTDRGDTWSQYGSDLPQHYGIICVFRTSQGTMLLGTAGGGVYCEGGAQGWTASTGDYSYPASFAEVFSTLFSTWGYRSADGGATWKQMKDSLLTRWPPIIIGNNGNTLYFSSDSGGVLTSTDTGKTWTRMDTSAFQPVHISELNVEQEILVGTTTGEVWSYGGSWSSRGSLGKQITSLVRDGATLFAGCWDGKVYRYDENGSWTPISTGLVITRVRSMAVNSRYLYAGTETGVFRRELSQVGPLASASLPVTSPGTLNFHSPSNPTWTAIDFPALTGSGNVVVMHFNSPPTAPQFSGTAPLNVSQYRWVIQQAGLSSFTAEVRFTVTPYLSGITNPSSVTIYARPAEDGGQFIPLSTTYFSAVQELRATVTGFSEFVLGSDNNTLTSQTDQVVTPLTTELSANWPNPFNPRTTLRYALARGGDVRLRVYDALGRVVSVLVDEKQDAGVHEVTFDASGFCSGVYFCRLEAGGLVKTRKLILLR